MATHEMRTMGASGDTKLVWDDDNEDEVANARRTYDDLKRKGFAAFAVGAKGERAAQVREFDPAAEKLIMVPALAGGSSGI